MVGKVIVVLGFILLLAGVTIIAALNIKLLLSDGSLSEKMFYMPPLKDAIKLFGGLAFVTVGLKMIGWF